MPISFQLLNLKKVYMYLLKKFNQLPWISEDLKMNDNKVSHIFITFNNLFKLIT